MLNFSGWPLKLGSPFKDTRNCQEKVKKISHLKPNQFALSIYIMKELCFFSLDQWEISLHLLWGKCLNIPHHCDPHLNQTKINELLRLTIAGVLGCFFQHWEVRADREREKKTLWPSFYLFLCSSLYLLILVSSYVIIDIWRQGLFIFMSDHLHILSSSYLAKSWSYCNSVFFIVFP